jgi:long-subunit fatty acid transport protein
MRAFWESNTTTATGFNAAGTQTSRTEGKESGVGTSYHAGLLWDITEDWRVTATLDTDQLGDPGGAVFGNNTDAPFIAIGARANF